MHKLQKRSIILVYVFTLIVSGLFAFINTAQVGAYTNNSSFLGNVSFVCEGPNYFENHMRPGSTEPLFIYNQGIAGGTLFVSIRCYSGAELQVVDGNSTTEDFAFVMTCGLPEANGAVTISNEGRNPQTNQNFLQATCSDPENFQIAVEGNYGGCSTNSGSTAEPCVPVAVEATFYGDIGDGDGEAPNESCEDNDGEFVFFQCAIIETASGAVNELDSRIRSALEVKPEYYGSGGVKEAWSNFRNIAYIILIPVLLVMVISTALGYSFVDAYTVKRALPRLFFAVIFIALSYEICVLMIEVIDIIGKGIINTIETGHTRVIVKKLKYPQIAIPPKNRNCLKLSGPKNLSSASTS